jgi:hypothetical protein
VDLDVIARHLGLVVGTKGRLGDADREGREVVQEECIEVIIGDHHDCVRPCRIEMHLHLAEEPRGLVRSILGDLGGIVRRVGDADAGDEFGHGQLQEQRALSKEYVFPRQMRKRKRQLR